MATPKTHPRTPSSPRSIPRPRRRSPSLESDRKRHRPNSRSPPPVPRSRSYYERPSWEREPYDRSRRPYLPQKRAPYAAPRVAPPRYENGFGPNGALRPPVMPHGLQINAKSRRLYIGNIPFQAGLTDVALTQFFSALYVAGFRPNRKGEPLPVVSFWLHADGKFGFMELRGEQEAVNMMQFNGIFLHGRPLRVNRPSDYRPELHNPAGMSLVPDSVNIQAVMELCSQLGTIVAAPAQLAAIAASQSGKPLVQKGLNAVDEVRAEVKPLRSQVMDVKGVNKDDDRSTEIDIDYQKGGADNAHVEKVEKKPPCVISLRNLVTDEDFNTTEEDWEDLVADIQTECSSYGDVKDLRVPRSGPWKGSVIVQYGSNADAVRAIGELRQKVFDGRKIESTLVDGCETADDAANRPPPS